MSDSTSTPPQLVKSIGAMNVVAWLERFFVIPQALGPIDLMEGDNANHPDITQHNDIAAAEKAASA